MSTGGVFRILSNEGPQEELTTNKEFLERRLKEIKAAKINYLRQQNPGISVEALEKRKQEWSVLLGEVEKSHLLFVHSTYKPFVDFANEYSSTPPSRGTPQFGQSFSFVIPTIGEFINDAVVYVRLTGLSATSALDKVRYFEMLGHRLMKRTAFCVANSEFDYYTSDVMNALYQFEVLPNKRDSYLRNIGQEVPTSGLLTADPATDEYREYRYFGEGPQTFKRTHSTVEMWIPLLFWFSNIKTALPNFLLPKNQAEVKIDLESDTNLIAYADYGGGGNYTAPSISCNLYVNHIFLVPHVHDIFIRNFGHQLIRVHRIHTQKLVANEGEVKLANIKWSVESIYFGFRPAANLTHSQKWHRNTVITERTSRQAIVTGASSIQVSNATYYAEANPIAKAELKASGNVLVPLIEPEFYNQYMSYRYGKNSICSPSIGWYCYHFAFEPGIYQPTGLLNASRVREFYLHYISGVNSATNVPYINNSAETDLIIIAKCINFIRFDKNSASLQFIT